jgi:hypothetical protein
LKIAMVPGTTPFLLSNTLLRALESLIATSKHQLILPKHEAKIPLQLTSKGLYLIDINQLTNLIPKNGESTRFAETFAHDSEKVPVQNDVPTAPEELLGMKVKGDMSRMAREESKGAQSNIMSSSSDAHTLATQNCNHQGQFPKACQKSQISSSTDSCRDSPDPHERPVFRATPACPRRHATGSSPRSATGIIGGSQAREDDVWENTCIIGRGRTY